MILIELSASEAEEAIETFMSIVKFETVSAIGVSNGSYQACVAYLSKLCIEAGLTDVRILEESVPGKPILRATLVGANPALPILLLNSHYDVVPAAEADWTVPPFAALRKDGKIFGRGTQDMKCVCVQYIAALKKLIANGFQPCRNVCLTFVPDEEIGGTDGMCVLLASSWYSTLDIALALDEGLASEDDAYSVFYGERLPWWVRVLARGNTGHGSRFIDGTAVEQVIGVANRALDFRASQRSLLHEGRQHTNCSHSVAAARKTTLGDVTTINVTMLRAGVRSGDIDVLNVVPPTAEAAFDIRISPHMPTSEMSSLLDSWCQEVQKNTPGLSGDSGVEWSFANKPLHEHKVTTPDSTNKWWTVFSDALGLLGIETKPEIFPAATDSRFLRQLGVRAFGFSPIRRSPIMLHENDEYLEESVFIEGCNVYIALLQPLLSNNTID